MTKSRVTKSLPAFFLILVIGLLLLPMNTATADSLLASTWGRGDGGSSSRPSPTPPVSEGSCSPTTTECTPGDGNPILPPEGPEASGDVVVSVVLFWMQGCPHCETVIDRVLPPLQKQYGEMLEVRLIELNNTQAVDQLYQMGARLGVSKDNRGVPFLLLGDNFLIGDQPIADQLPGLVEQYLARGGIDFPAIPEFHITGDNRTAPEIPGPTAAPHQTIIYLFWGDGCPHCAMAKPFLLALDQNSEGVDLSMYEVWYVEENRVLMTNMTAAFGFEPHAVPTIFIGDQYWEGYNEQIQNEIRAAVDRCLLDGCPDAGAGIVPGATNLTGNPEATRSEVITPPTSENSTIDLPIIGATDLTSHSLLIGTLLIAFVDGFNPCSVWVLSMLLALTLHTGSRKKVFIIGVIFLTVTAGIYALFIAGMFTMFKVVSYVGWIQVVVAVVALLFALVNIKDYFWYKQGVSFTIADEKKPGIFHRIRKLMDASQSFWGLAGGTIVLAGGVSLVEFSCTAGFPVLWTNLLVAQNVPAITFVFLLLVYLAVYQLDEMGLFLVAVYSMRASRLEEKHGRILKLVGGMLMLSLAGVMLIDPNLMNNLGSSLTIFGAAFGATLIILLVHRLILPKFGLRIGTEFGGKPNKT